MRILALALLLLAAPAVAQPVETHDEALAEDAVLYAGQFGVSPDEALRRLRAQQASVDATNAIAREFSSRLAGISIDHRPDLRIVVLLTGDDPVAERRVAGVPILFRTGAKATHAEAVEALRKHLIDLRTDLPGARGAGYDQRTGEVVLLVTPRDAQRFGIDSIRARAEAISAVPVRVMINSLDEANLTVDGGGRVEGVSSVTGRRSRCTAGFVVTNGEQTAIATAAHCPDQLTYVDQDGASVSLPMIGSWGAGYQDVQINGSPDSPQPLFYANRGANALRRVETWRNAASTRAGDFVCHYGDSSGYSCALVQLTIMPRPAPCAAGPAHRPGLPSTGRAVSLAIAAGRCSAARSRSASPRASIARATAAISIITCRRTICRRRGGCSLRETLLRERVAPDLIGTGHGLGRIVADLHHPVPVIDVDHMRLHRPSFGVAQQRVAHDDHQVAGMDEVRGCAVDADHAAAGGPGDHIGLDPGAVSDVGDRHLLAFEQVGRLHQRSVERDRADVMQIGLGHRRSVDLRFHHDSHHGRSSSWGRSAAPDSRFASVRRLSMLHRSIALAA
jgi:hypothetical protein